MNSKTESKIMEQCALPTKPERKYLSSEGLISYLKDFADLRVSRSNLYKLTMSGAIPHIKGPGGRLLFPIIAIRRWVENGGDVDQAGNPGQGGE